MSPSERAPNLIYRYFQGTNTGYKKDAFKVQEGPREFNKKFINMVSDPTL